MIPKTEPSNLILKNYYTLKKAKLTQMLKPKFKSL